MIPTPRNSGTRKSLKLSEVAKLVGGEVVGDTGVSITGVSGIKEAKKGDITFLANTKYLSSLESTEASAVITSPQVKFSKIPLIWTDSPSMAFSKVVSFFSTPLSKKSPEIHPTAVIHSSATLGKQIHVGPHVVIEEGVKIGDRSSIAAGVFVGSHSLIGEDVVIYPQVTIREHSEIGHRVIIHSGTVIGSDGFGFETVEGVHLKIPQEGSVLIEEDVEIGANCCVDRGRFKKTWIQKGTKIDNLVQVAHNVVIGAHCLVVSQVGISGSTELGHHVVVAGQAGLVGHIQLGNGVIVGARSGVTKSFPAHTVLLGEPARPIQEQRKILAAVARLPELLKQFSKIKKKLLGESGDK